MNFDRFDILMTFVIVVLLISLSFYGGWMFNDYYQIKKHKKLIDGFQVANITEDTAIRTAQKFNEFGNWVCVDVLGMNWEEAQRICNHELAHEMFARHCEDNVDVCMEVIEREK